MKSANHTNFFKFFFGGGGGGVREEGDCWFRQIEKETCNNPWPSIIIINKLKIAKIHRFLTTCKSIKWLKNCLIWFNTFCIPLFYSFLRYIIKILLYRYSYLNTQISRTDWRKILANYKRSCLCRSISSTLSWKLIYSAGFPVYHHLSL